MRKALFPLVIFFTNVSLSFAQVTDFCDLSCYGLRHFICIYKCYPPKWKCEAVQQDYTYRHTLESSINRLRNDIADNKYPSIHFENVFNYYMMRYSVDLEYIASCWLYYIVPDIEKKPYPCLRSIRPGEISYTYYGGDFQGTQQMIDDWSDDIEIINPSDIDDFPGHNVTKSPKLVQLIFSHTTRFGCAVVICGEKRYEFCLFNASPVVGEPLIGVEIFNPNDPEECIKVKEFPKLCDYTDETYSVDDLYWEGLCEPGTADAGISYRPLEILYFVALYLIIVVNY